jgi:hypothetical protein
MLQLSQYLTSNYIIDYRAIAIKTAWYWHKNKYKDQWNKMEDLDMNLQSYAHVIFDSHQKHMIENKRPLQQMWLGKVFICLQKIETRSVPITLY